MKKLKSTRLLYVGRGLTGLHRNRKIEVTNSRPQPQYSWRVWKGRDVTDRKLTREELEKRMDELARLYAETHDPEVAAEVWELSRRLGELSYTRH